MTASTDVAVRDGGAVMVEKVLVGGDLSKLTPGERLMYIQRVCESLGLNPLTRPFEYLTLKGKLVLYARKDATEQLRTLRGISIEKPDITYVDDMVVVTVGAQDRTGRRDHDMGAVIIANLKGDDKINAILKAITKAKRRVTLSICGLGILDETEVQPEELGASVSMRDGELILQESAVNTPPSDAEMEEWRESVESYRAEYPELVAVLESRAGPVDTWTLAALQKGDAWLASKTTSVQAPALAPAPRDDPAADVEADTQEQLADALELARTAIDHVSKKRGGPTVDDASAMRDVLSELQRLEPRADDKPPREIASKDLVAVIAKRLPASQAPEAVGVGGTLLADDQPF